MRRGTLLHLIIQHRTLRSSENSEIKLGFLGHFIKVYLSRVRTEHILSNSEAA